ncbi:MAG: EAL domain-containing protein [Chromatiaceae bacterium]|nr:EAL domain-containing protein [Chromatiaceae bacterium]
MSDDTPAASSPSTKDAVNERVIRERALEALRQGRFDLVEDILTGVEPSPSLLIENLRIYQAELEIQNEELQRSYRRTQQGLDRFMTFFNSLPIAELVIDRHGLIKEANHEAQRLFGLGNAHFHQHFFARLIAEQQRGQVIHAWSHLPEQASRRIEEVALRASDGHLFTADLHIAALASEIEDEVHYVCAIIDRTEAVRQRHALRDLSEQLRENSLSLTERLKELAALHDVLAETSRIDTDPGEVIERVVKRLPAAWQFPEIAEARIQLPTLSAQTSGFRLTPWMQSSPITLPDGTAGEVCVTYRTEPLTRHADVFLPEEADLIRGIATHLSVFFARHADESRLRDSRERYRVLAEFNPEWEYWVGPDGKFLYISPACQRLTGYKAEELLANPQLIEHLIDPRDSDLWQRHSDQTQHQALDAPCLMELRIRTRDDQERWIEHVCAPVRTEDGRFLGRRGVNRDITARKHIEQELRRSEAFLNATGSIARVGGWELERGSDTLRCTQSTFEILERAPSERLALREWLGFFQADDRRILTQCIEHAFEQHHRCDLQLRLDTAQGRSLWVQVTGQPVIEQGETRRILGTLQDITSRMEADASLRQAARVFESTVDGVVITDPNERILAVNRAFTQITGYQEEEVLGQTPRILQSGHHNADFYRAMWDALKRHGQWRGEIWNRHKSGELYPEQLTISSVQDGAGRLTHYVGLFRDISQLKESERQLEYLAHHDPLTGLPNRCLFQSRLEQSLARSKRSGQPLALLFLDLDRFKVVNDTLGHPVGDLLLQQVAEALSSQVRPADTIARLGGDEFVIVLEDILDLKDVEHFANRLLNLLSQPFLIDGRELYITASIGISVHPRDGNTPDILLRHADIAMYQAKAEGRNDYSFFEPIMSEGAAERLRIENELRGALQREEFIIHYQPQIGLEDAHLRGVEALCRWSHPQLGEVSPGQFIPLAEEIGLIGDISAWVLEEGCRQLIRWDQEGFRIPRLAVNLSMRDIERPNLVEQVQDCLARTGLEPERLELEVTESMIMRRTEEAIATLDALRRLGVALAVDDFGTGFSSLAYLKRLPLHRLKIDRGFVEKLTEDPNDDMIVRAVIALGRSLGLEVLAEGIETPAQIEFLCREGCTEGQGYLFSRPISAEQLIDEWRHRL